ncbi:MAG: minichromosome maintenance protein MCM [Candidatus Aenigmarchaeota archaeon]|nr:minichromosome maintenance protein MCM [Candidatus Aenigmarchaeota archaeon]
MEKEEITKRFIHFLREKYYQDLLEAVRSGLPSLEIDFKVLDEFDTPLSEKLLYQPEETLKIFDQSLKEIDLPDSVEIRFRFRNLPEFACIPIRHLRSHHIGQFVSVEGTVRRSSEILPEISETVWICPQCGSRIVLEQNERTMKKPISCDCGYKGRFELFSKKLVDTRWIQIEEPFESTEGEKPSQLNIYLCDDLTSQRMRPKTDAGNRLRITGIMKEVPKVTQKGRRSVQLDILLAANHVETTEIEASELKITPEDEQRIIELSKDPNVYEKVIGSIATSTYGLQEIKEAIAYQLFSGVPHIMKDGTRIRGDIHILLIGEPSTGKSQLLKLVSKLANRGKYVSGKGSSSVGLTASVLKDEQFSGGWVLEAGAIVLANKGLCSIDEFEKMHENDQVALHECMEQQTVSVAKASIIATLPAQTAMLAAANPKFGRFDFMKGIAEQITVSETLLSRFDLKFALFDVPDLEKDTKIAEHMMKSRTLENYSEGEPVFDPIFLRKYIAYARKNCFPKMTAEVGEIIKKFYIETRSKYVQRGPISITPRQYEALIRLAQASAKMRLSPVVTEDDARRAIKLLQTSLQQLGLDKDTGLIDIDKIESGTSSSQRNKILAILDIVDSLTKEIGKVIPIEDVLAAAGNEGINESDTMEVIERLKRDGQLMEPKYKHLQKV